MADKPKSDDGLFFAGFFFVVVFLSLSVGGVYLAIRFVHWAWETSM